MTERRVKRMPNRESTSTGEGATAEELLLKQQKAVFGQASPLTGATASPPVGGTTAADIPTVTMWGDVWRRLRRNRLAIIGTAVIMTLMLTAVLAPLIAPYDPAKQNLDISLHGPSLRHWFGTDILGRDYFSRVVYGSRVSITIGIVVTFIMLAIGLPLGAVAGYFGRAPDAIIMRSADVFFAFPFIVGAIIVITALGPNFPRLLSLFIGIGLLSWATVARLFRSSILQIKNLDYVEAARALGAGHFRILTRHIIPNALAPVIVFSTIATGTVILTEAALSFLGLGVAVGTPAWGLMISEGRNFMTSQPWLVLFPGFATMLTVLGFIFLGDGLRDSMDPRLR